MLITYIKRSNCGRQWIILYPVLDSHVIKIIERFEKIALIREMLEGNKLYVSCKVAVKNMAYINKIRKTNFAEKSLLCSAAQAIPAHTRTSRCSPLRLLFAECRNIMIKFPNYFTVIHLKC